MTSKKLASYAEITSLITLDRQISLRGNLGSAMKNLALGKLEELGKSSGEILCRITSDGGNYYHGLELYEAFRKSTNRIVGLVEGTARSAAFMALQGCSVRIARKNATLFIHNPEYYNTIVPIRHNTSLAEWLHHSRGVYEANHDSVVMNREMTINILVERSGILKRGDVETLLEQSHEMSAGTALKLGFLDQVIV